MTLKSMWRSIVYRQKSGPDSTVAEEQMKLSPHAVVVHVALSADLAETFEVLAAGVRPPRGFDFGGLGQRQSPKLHNHQLFGKVLINLSLLQRSTIHIPKQIHVEAVTTDKNRKEHLKLAGLTWASCLIATAFTGRLVSSLGCQSSAMRSSKS